MAFFYVRLEDTDTKREIEGAGEALLNEMASFNVAPSEGYLGRKKAEVTGLTNKVIALDIYKVVIKEMIKSGSAYPCFLHKP